MHRMIRGLILDMDGTLIDSNEAHALSYLRAFRDEGLNYALDEVCPLIGMGGDKLIPALCGISESDEKGRRISQRKRRVFQEEFLARLRPTPGAEKLLIRLREMGLKLGIATSATTNELQAFLKILHSEVGNSKPDSDTISVALKKLGTYPGETLMIGDTVYDIEAALKEGIQTIALRCGGRSDDELVGALAIYDHPMDLLEHLETSPLSSALLLNPHLRSA